MAPVQNAEGAFVAPQPLVKPDLSAATITSSVDEVATVAAPFIPAKVRVALYTASGVVAVVAGAAGAILGGQIGEALIIAGSAAASVSPILAVSHVTK